MAKLYFDEKMIRKTYEEYQGGLHEIRVIPYKDMKFTLSGFFDNADDLIKEIEKNNLESTPFFMTLNCVNPDSECIGKLNVIRKSYKTVSDKDIDKYAKIHIDIDPEKSDPHGQATDEEVKYAEAKLNEVYKSLREFGFPEGITAFSGNGFNIDFYADITNTNENKIIIKTFLKLLSDMFSDEHVKIDTTTYNPGRIIKYFGCVSCKGDNTSDRPYRLTRIISVPDKKENLTLEQINSFIQVHSPKKKTKSGSKNTSSGGSLVAKIADVDAWLDNYNISYNKKECDYNGEKATIYALEECQFTKHDNNNCSFIIKYSDGNCFYKCHHDHCNFTIHDFLKKYPVVNQIQLVCGEGDIVDIYNQVASGIDLIKSDDNKRYVLRKDTNQILSYDNTDFDNYITEKAQELGKIISNNNVTTIKSNFRGAYEKYAIKAPVSRRIAYDEEWIYYAVDKDYTIAVRSGEITQYKGKNVFFYYNEKFKPQTIPDLTSPANELPGLVKKVFNISDEYFYAFLAQLCTFFIPHINNPILVLSGGQGTSKSTTSEKLKELVDPTNTEVMSLPETGNDLLASLSSSYLVAYDNITNISTTFSDIFCISVTKGVAPKRKLYSNNELVEVKLNANIILNGIEDIIKRSDLAERTNMIYLDRITHRLTDKQVWTDFEAVKPKILGSIFNTIKTGLLYVDEMNRNITDLPRMADFAVYGAAMIKAMGLDYRKFLAQYTGTTNELLSDRAELDDFVILLNKFLSENNNEWKGSANELLNLLNISAQKNRLPIEKFTANTLSRKLNAMQTNLKAAGIDFGRGRDGKRYLTLTKENDAVSSQQVNHVDEQHSDGIIF